MYIYRKLIFFQENLHDLLAKSFSNPFSLVLSGNNEPMQGSNQFIAP